MPQRPWCLTNTCLCIDQDKLVPGLPTFGFVLKEVLHLAGGTVVRDNGETLVVHVEDEVLALESRNEHTAWRVSQIDD